MQPAEAFNVIQPEESVGNTHWLFAELLRKNLFQRIFLVATAHQWGLHSPLDYATRSSMLLVVETELANFKFELVSFKRKIDFIQSSDVRDKERRYPPAEANSVNDRNLGKKF